MIEERKFDAPCDSHKRKKFVKMEMVAATIEQNVEDHVSDIMEDMLETETKLWYRKLEGYCRDNYSDLNVEERSSCEVFQLENKIKMSYKMVQHLASE